ncbi:HIRAN domain-containing protein [Uliginosibacterium sp. H3]|uniref:HIRAN domain-containing protein n=1 Tax=Uliginosibacterium silvisoli TaxID=3114758 RepID=A0ABU6K4V6_9RHOO|nr:HIRAN domain-containing protein [Uliginosibacterium sp. H3]
MAASRVCLLTPLLLIAALLFVSAHAATRVRVQTVTLAGVGYHQGGDVWPLLHEGDALTLVREADNKHDPLAVRVDWQGHVLGYVPRDQSGPIAAALDRGTSLSARISKLREHPNPRERILIEVFAEFR